MEEMDGNETMTVPLTQLAELYDVLIEGNLVEINNFAKNNYGRELDGTELMFINVTKICHHELTFENLTPTCQIGVWLSTQMCSCNVLETGGYKAGFYPMHVAVITSNYTLIDYLLSKGSSVNLPTYNYRLSPLYSYIWQNEQDAAIEMVKFLMERDLDVLQCNAKGFTLLHACAQKGHAEVLAYLLQHGALSQINAMSDSGSTPLMLATRERQYECVKELLAHKVDVNFANSSGFTPLYCALRMASQNIVELLLESDNIDVNLKPLRGHRSMSALHVAIQQVNIDLVEKLLKKGANPNDLAESDLTPLMMASYMNSPDAARLLLKYNGDVNLANNQGYSPIHNAAWDGHEELVQIFLDAGAKHDTKASDGNTPLSLACHGEHVHIVSLLIPWGCDVNNKDKDNDMPLHYASYNGCLETVKALIEQGADPDAPNRLATTPLWNAAYLAHTKVVRYLMQYNPDLSIRSCGIQQHAQSTGVTVCFSTPKSVLYAATRACAKVDDRRTLEILLAAGLKLQEELWLFQEEKPEWMFGEVGMWLLKEAHKPSSLLRLCRQLIRDMLRGWCDLNTQVNNMEIPHTLKAFLLTHHL